MSANLLSLSYITLCLVFISLWATPSVAENVDPVLIKALHQATRDETLQTTDLDSLAWLSSMSVRLEKRIPDPFYRVRLLETVYQEALANGLDPQMVLAVMDIESNFNRYAISSAGAQGLMQVMPFWKEEFNQPNADLFNPLTSIRYGCLILRRYMDRFSTTEDALAAYNGSYGRTTYSDKILLRWRSRWQYKDDIYDSDSQIRVAVGDVVAPPLAN